LKRKIIIGVTGVGGGVGQSVIKCLKNNYFIIVGLDSKEDATGLYMCDKSFIIPQASESNYISRLLSICKKNKIKFLFPGLDTELSKLSSNIDLFRSNGTEIIISNKEVIQIANDKLATYEYFREENFVKTRLFNKSNNNFDYPIVIKQRKDGCRSKNVFIINNKIEFENFIARKDLKFSNFITCEYLEGDEFTCGTINFDGKCQGVICMKRILRNGDTYKCYTQKNSLVEDYAIHLMEKLKPHGPCNLQLKLDNGEPRAFEINARCSGTTAARALCGFNEPLMTIDYFLKNKIPKIKITNNTIYRYWEELVISKSS